MLDLPRAHFCRALKRLLGLLLHAGNSTARPLPKPEGATARLLSPRVAPCVLEDLAADVAHPVQVLELCRYRILIVLRLYAVVIDRATGLVGSAMLEDDGCRLVAPANRPEPGVRLLNSPHGGDWPRYWLTNWCRRNGYACESSNINRTIRRAAPALWAHAHRTLDLRAMRRMIAAALGWQPMHWRRAVRLAHAAHSDPDHRDYNAAVRFTANLDVLEREAPNLMAPWFALARAGELVTEVEPKAALKRWVQGAAGGDRAWKSLAASSVRVWMAWGMHRQGSAAHHLRDTVRLVKLFATPEPVPLRLMRALTSRLDPLVSVDEAIKRQRCAFYQIALQPAREAIENGIWPQFAAELDDVDAWFYLETPRLDKRQRRRGWPWLARKAAAWAEMQRRQSQARQSLMPELAPVELRGHVFRAASSAFDLWNAGRLLRNCLGAGTYARAISNAQTLLVTANRIRDGRMVAAIDLRAGGNRQDLAVARAHGFANGPVPREVQLALGGVEEHFAAQCASRLLPWRIGNSRVPARVLAHCPLPVAAGAEESDLLLFSDGTVRLGHWRLDCSTPSIQRRFVTARIVHGGQAQRLADHAVTQTGRKIERLPALAKAIASALCTEPGHDHWLAMFGAVVPAPGRQRAEGKQIAPGAVEPRDAH